MRPVLAYHWQSLNKILKRMLGKVGVSSTGTACVFQHFFMIIVLICTWLDAWESKGRLFFVSLPEKFSGTYFSKLYYFSLTLFSLVFHSTSQLKLISTRLKNQKHWFSDTCQDVECLSAQMCRIRSQTTKLWRNKRWFEMMSLTLYERIEIPRWTQCIRSKHFDQ